MNEKVAKFHKQHFPHIFILRLFGKFTIEIVGGAYLGLRSVATDGRVSFLENSFQPPTVSRAPPLCDLHLFLTNSGKKLVLDWDCQIVNEIIYIYIYIYMYVCMYVCMYVFMYI